MIFKQIMSADEVSHIRHEICIANDAAKALWSMVSKGQFAPDVHSLLKRATEKLDEILGYIDGTAAVKEIITQPQALTQAGPCDAVLVDDDPLVRSAWKLQARQAGKALRMFASAEELLANVDSLNSETPIYIDPGLRSSQMQGIALAEELHLRGFRELYLSTGLAKDNCSAPAFIREVRGKTPPWYR